jgi:hypothetical protein
MVKEGFVYVCLTARASNARDSLDIDDRPPTLDRFRSAHACWAYFLRSGLFLILYKYCYIE